MSALTTYKRQMAGRVVGESLEVAKLVSSKHQLVEARSQQQCKTTVAFDNTSHPSYSYNCRIGRLNITPGPLIKKQLVVKKMRCRWKMPSWALSRWEHICRRMHWTSFIWAEWWWERSIWRESMYRHSLERGGDQGRFIDRELHRCQYCSSHFPHGGNLLVLTQPLQWEIIFSPWVFKWEIFLSLCEKYFLLNWVSEVSGRRNISTLLNVLEWQGDEHKGALLACLIGPSCTPVVKNLLGFWYV